MPKKRRAPPPSVNLIGDPPPLVVPLPVVELQTDKADDAPRGLLCPSCGCGHFEVVWVRPKNRKIERRRECRHCGRRITTYETAAFDAPAARYTGVTHWQTISD